MRRQRCGGESTGVAPHHAARARGTSVKSLPVNGLRSRYIRHVLCDAAPVTAVPFRLATPAFMTAPKPILGISTRPRPVGATRSVAVTSGAWDVVAIFGAAWALLGIADITLGWYPAAFDSPEWEFATISNSLIALTIPAQGLCLFLAAMVATHRVRLARTASIVLVLLAAVALVWGFLYVTLIPMAFKATGNNVLVLTGLKKSIAKSLLLVVAYPTVFIWCAILGWRRARPAGE